MNQGVENLLSECVALKAGQSLLLVTDDAADSVYSPQAPALVRAHAESLGADVTQVVQGSVESVADFPASLAKQLDAVDHVLFFSPVGDQVRFQKLGSASSKTMVYAHSEAHLRSPMTGVSHNLTQAILNRLVECLSPGTVWRMTCPLGTDVSGLIKHAPGADEGRFTLGLFPTMIFDPIMCHQTSGQVALSRWLMSTSTDRYEASDLTLTSTLFADVSDREIVGFRGDASLVQRVRDQYERIAEVFDAEPYTLHSWHTGINPNVSLPGVAEEDMTRWKALSFGSPRYTHFHTCAQNPGQIAWSLFDTSITLNGEVFWQNGRLAFLERPEFRGLFDAHPEALAALSVHHSIGV